MPFPTTNAKQELPAINQILTSCGQAPVTTLDQTNPEVAIAYDTLLQVSREVQSEGWTFNREYHYTDITPDVNKEILIPNNIIQIKLSEDSQNTSHDGIRRSGKLYDRQNHTYQWDYSPEFDIIWYFDWIDLPDPIQTYITARAATLVSGKIVGDDDQYARLQQQEALARSSAMEYETSQGQFTMFGHPQGQQNYYQSYQPFHALQR
ncbi:MAG: hypothetical protein CMA50_04430 [Euryarchaeota archaeon]|mgnify:FL=1|nr:hypothetical protein [Euryarchaeota archaeon]|tara:strand:+ start:1689 stop:2309 length:621 start_codon:yes stop_codon:yes gene_type:complete